MKKYKIIVNDIKRDIKNGFIKKGDKLFTEQEYMEIYKVSRITVQTAMQNLKNDGIIYRKPGVGTYVSDSNDNFITNRKFIACIIVNTVNELLVIADGVNYTLEKNNHFMSLKISHAKSEIELENCKQAIINGAKGLIVFPISEESNKEYFMDLINKQFPVVFIDRAPTRQPCNIVSTNNYLGLKTMTEYVIRCGHKNIIYINSGTLEPLVERLNGFVDTMKSYNLPVPEENILDFKQNIINLDDNLSFLHEKLDEIFRKSERPTAVICCNDIIAINVVKKLRQMGLNVPEDVSVAGYDNMAASSQSPYSLTTVEQNFFKMGEFAAKLLLDYINSKESINKISITPQLIIRNSIKLFLRNLNGCSLF